MEESGCILIQANYPGISLEEVRKLTSNLGQNRQSLAHDLNNTIVSTFKSWNQ
jgi:hypothetical protein